MQSLQAVLSEYRWLIHISSLFIVACGRLPPLGLFSARKFTEGPRFAKDKTTASDRDLGMHRRRCNSAVILAWLVVGSDTVAPAHMRRETSEKQYRAWAPSKYGPKARLARSKLKLGHRNDGFLALLASAPGFGLIDAFTPEAPLPCRRVSYFARHCSWTSSACSAPFPGRAPNIFRLHIWIAGVREGQLVTTPVRGEARGAANYSCISSAVRVTSGRSGDVAVARHRDVDISL